MNVDVGIITESPFYAQTIQYIEQKIYRKDEERQTKYMH
jgi:hypothetical protein